MQFKEENLIQLGHFFFLERNRNFVLISQRIWPFFGNVFVVLTSLASYMGHSKLQHKRLETRYHRPPYQVPNLNCCTCDFKIEPGYLKTQNPRPGLSPLERQNHVTGMSTRCHIKILYMETTGFPVGAFLKTIASVLWKRFCRTNSFGLLYIWDILS